MRRLLPFATALVALAAPAAAPATPAADDSRALFEALRSVDLRLATIAYRLTTANAPLCRDLAPTPGWALHALGQYDPARRADARTVFGFPAPVAVEAVVPGSEAARAGIAANDGLVAVNGKPVDGAPGAGTSSKARDAAAALIAGQPAGPLRLTLRRDGAERTVTLRPPQGCRSQFEVLVVPKLEASADGSIVQIGSRFFEKYDDEAIAVVVAHELAHNILRHRARLDAAKVDRGLLAEFGRNGRLFRRTEDEADLLGLHLLRNAGYDPRAAVRFWREHGGDVDGGLFRSRTHGSSRARADALEAELARLPADAPRPYAPPLLATRDEPLR